MTKKKRQRAPDAAGHRSATRESSGGRARTTSLASLSTIAQPLALVVALAIIAYANALRNGFALDDIPIVVENPVIRSVGNVGSIFGTSYWSRGGTATLGDPTLYRPLTVFTYAVDFAIWNLRPAGFHATNVVLHAIATALLFLLAAELLGSVVAAFAAASIFAVHPLHTEAVTGVVGRAEVLATLFFLAAFLTLRRRAAFRARSVARSAIGAAFYLLGLLCKETAITLPAVLALDDWLRRHELPNDRRSATMVVASRYGALALAAIVYFALRRHAITGNPEIWPGFVGVPTGHRVLTASRVMMEDLGLFVFPRTLLADYWKTEVPIAASLGDPLVLGSVLLWAALAALVFRTLRHDSPISGTERRSVVLSLAWFFITIAPVSNLLFPIGVAKAERVLYLPSAGLCLLAGWAYARIEPRVRASWMPRVALASVLMVFIARTAIRNKDWHDNLTLATATLAVSPSSPLMNDIAAGELVRRGDLKRAVDLLREAVRQAPDMPLVRTHLGIVYYSQGLLDQAIAEYHEAIQRHPTDAEAHNNLGVAYAARGQLDLATDAYREALRLRPSYSAARENLARVTAARVQGASKP